MYLWYRVCRTGPWYLVLGCMRMVKDYFFISSLLFIYCMLEVYPVALINLTFPPLVAIFVISKVPLQIDWIQITPDKLFDADGILFCLF